MNIASIFAAFLALLLVIAAVVTRAQGIGELGFTTRVSARLMDSYAQRFRSPQARPRLESWKKFASEEKARGGAAREIDRLNTVNRLLNRLPFVDDERHWGSPDYWATPAESVASNGADCEDFSIAKYFLLKELGVPVSRLRLVYVKALKLNQAHMVVAYYATPGSEPLVLDNLEDAVRPASQRNDLVPVYSFNDEEVWVETKGRIGSPRQIRNWSALLERLEGEARL
jgi:predicted transglutaminase-like cysteine proteinase